MQMQNFNISQKYAVDGAYSRYVEVELSDPSSDQHLRFRIEIEAEGHPRVTESLLEGLRAARNVIGAKIQALSTLEPFGL
jgi:hypothetical protein